MRTYLISSVILTSLPAFFYYLIKRKYSRKFKQLQDKYEFAKNYYYYHTIFVDMNNLNCSSHLKYKRECGPHCSAAEMNRICKFLSSAKESLSVCLYLTTLKQVYKGILELHQKGVKVRVICDVVMSRMKASQMDVLLEAGIPVKTNAEDTIMHHKFVLVDQNDENRAKMFFGSTNLTGQAFIHNFDCIVCTNNTQIVERFSEEFEELWACLEPLVIKE